MSVTLAKSAGFCFGVSRAVETVEKQAAEGNAPSGGALMPNYLRLSQAEREKLERMKK